MAMWNEIRATGRAQEMEQMLDPKCSIETSDGKQFCKAPDSFWLGLCMLISPVTTKNNVAGNRNTVFGAGGMRGIISEDM